MRSSVVEALMGVVVLVVAGAFLYLAYTMSVVTSSKGIEAIAKFQRIDGLVLGNDVRVSGVKVGKVSKIEIDPKTFFAKVTFSIDKDLRLPADSSAAILSESLLGGKYLSVSPGGSKTFLAPGQELERTVPAVNFESLLSKFLFSDTKKAKGSDHEDDDDEADEEESDEKGQEIAPSKQNA